VAISAKGVSCVQHAPPHFKTQVGLREGMNVGKIRQALAALSMDPFFFFLIIHNHSRGLHVAPMWHVASVNFHNSTFFCNPIFAWYDKAR
jgi:hypothetical protein